MGEHLTASLLFYLWNTNAAPSNPVICAPPVVDNCFSGQFFATPIYTPLTTGFIYDVVTLDLYVLFSNNSITGFAGVPLQVATSFNYAKNPDLFYQNDILPIFTQTFVCGTPPLG